MVVVTLAIFLLIDRVAAKGALQRARRATGDAPCGVRRGGPEVAGFGGVWVMAARLKMR
ncbi:MAG: hypothetical protein ACKVQK_10540 [Burkholderiales bacterium]